MRTIHLPIAEPCHEDWEAMDVGERSRFCGRCTKDVHDLASMTEPEARALLRAHAGGRICVRYAHDAEGRIHFRRAEGLARAALAGIALAACTPHDHPQAQAGAAAPRNTAAVHHVVGDLVPPAVEPERVTMGEPPMIEPVVQPKMGRIAAPPPVVQHLKGDIAVPNEPCDPPPSATALPRWHEGMR